MESYITIIINTTINLLCTQKPSTVELKITTQITCTYIKVKGPFKKETGDIIVWTP